jgi:hypothetical protein
MVDEPQRLLLLSHFADISRRFREYLEIIDTARQRSA